MSLLEKLKDKINYKLFKALDDPEAATYAAEQAQQKAEQTAVERKKEAQEEAKVAREKELAEAEANKPMSPIKAVGNGTLKVFLYGLGAYLVTSYGSMAANTAIHRHPLIRLLFFVFGSLVGLVVLIFSLPIPPLLFGLVAAHLIMRKLDLLPHEYNFLPLIQYESSNNIFYEFLQNYVIAWDPNDKDHNEHYKSKINGYMDILSSSLAAVSKAAGVKEDSK